MPDRDTTDIAIVGGGLVGACLAFSLRRLPFRVTVLEAFEIGHAQQPSFDDRSVAVAHGSVLLLQQMGIWEHLKQYGCGIQQIQVSEKGRFGVTRMNAEEEHVDALGYVLENRLIGRVLAERLHDVTQSGQIQWLAPAKVNDVHVLENHVQLDYAYQGVQRSLKSSLVVAADGAHSIVRRKMSLPVKEKEYGIHTLIANVQTQLPHRGVAYERFTPSGPLACLPLNDFAAQHRSAIVVSLKQHELERWRGYYFL